MSAALHVTQFDYVLPPGQIAQSPAAPADQARLLVCPLAGGPLVHTRMTALPQWLTPGDLLVVNDTKVLPARLTGQRWPGGGRVQLVLLNRVGPWDAHPAGEIWDCLARPGRRLAAGVALTLGQGRLRGVVLAVLPSGGRRIGLHAADGTPLAPVLTAVGELPLPPYLRRPVTGAQYQTMFAHHAGSLAAPTAGLHFTPPLMSALAARGIKVGRLTLHVGPGTFLPVRVQAIDQHQLPPEYVRVSAELAAAVAAARRDGRRVVAVGTTAARALETAGRAAAERPDRQGQSGLANQSDSASQCGSASQPGAANQHGPSGQIRPYEGWTDLFIYSGYRFRVVDALLTNFHLPRSTLLMLVCAFAGRERVLGVYEEALAAGYRFASLGDASLWIGTGAGTGP